MGEAIGIDFGTNNSVVAYQTRNVQVLKNNENDELTPSWVSCQGGRYLVGRPAYNLAAVAEKDTVYAIKRLIGRAYGDEEVQRFVRFAPFQVTSPENGTDDDLRIVIGAKPHSPIEVASVILKKLREDSQTRLRKEVTHAVITVPANFSEKQYAATRRAAEMAKISVLRLLQEPFAAAISYGVDNIGSDEVRKVVVFDIGAGTFDVSVLMCTGGTFEILQHGGDRWLGGEDMDKRIMSQVLDQVKAKHGIDGSGQRDFLMALRQAAEQAKIQLSSAEQADVMVPGKLKDARGTLVNVEYPLARTAFEALIDEDVRRAVDLTLATLERAGLAANEIDNVLLVGGPTNIPLVRRAVERAFGADRVASNVEVDPMTCVARGAAVLAKRLQAADQVECVSCGAQQPSKNETCSKCGKRVHAVDIPTGVTRMNIGIEMEGGRFATVLEAGTPFGTSKSRVFYTPAQGMRRLRVPVLQGESEEAAKNERIAIAWIPLPSSQAMNTPVEVAFGLTKNGDFDEEGSVVRIVGGAGASFRFRIDRGTDRRDVVERKLFEVEKKLAENQGRMDEEELATIRKEENEVNSALAAGNLDDADRRLQAMEKRVSAAGPREEEWVGTCEFWIDFVDRMIRDLGALLDGDASYDLEKLAKQLRNDVDARDEQSATTRKDALIKKIDELPPVCWNLMYALLVIPRVERQDPVKGDKIRRLRGDLLSALQAGRKDEALRANDELIVLLNEASESGPRKTGDTRVDLLSGSKKPLVGPATYRK